MPRLKLTLAYEGTRYAGWQLQAGTAEGRPSAIHTIQGELEACVARIVGHRIPVHGAGRTDAGVHAEAQVCHLDLPDEKSGVDWRRALNAHLPPDIRIIGADWVDASFHSRKSARRKRYSYAIWCGGDRPLPRIRPYVCDCPPLDLDRMRQAAALLTGRRDFASFRNRGTDAGGTVRTLYSIEMLPGMTGMMVCPPEWPVTAFVFEGDGFLKQMVRNLMGLLIWAGRGKVDLDAIPAIFAAHDRTALPSPSAPSHGLTLLEVLY